MTSEKKTEEHWKQVREERNLRIDKTINGLAFVRMALQGFDYSLLQMIIDLNDIKESKEVAPFQDYADIVLELANSLVRAGIGRDVIEDLLSGAQVLQCSQCLKEGPWTMFELGEEVH